MYEEEKEKEKKYLKTFLNTVVIKTHFKRRTSKEVLIGLY